MTLHTSKDINTLSHELAEWIIDDIKKILTKNGLYTLVLSGGNTPKKLYETLAALPYRDQIDWKKIHILFGDERYVPFEDERNNGKMAYDTLLKHVPVPEDQIHYMNTALPPKQSAQEYEKILHQYFSNSSFTFDLVLLGMGDDGHTLSLFPHSKIIHEQTAWVAFPYVEKQKMYRITLTSPVVNKSNAVAFLAAGNKKAKILQHVLEDPYQPDTYPSQIIKPENDNLHWFVDKEAASRLKDK